MLEVLMSDIAVTIVQGIMTYCVLNGNERYCNK